MIVLDASASVGISRGTQDGMALLSLIEPEEHIIAPTWQKIEVRNAFWKYVRGGFISKEDALRYIHSSDELVTRFVNVDDYLKEAFAEAVSRNHPIYDMLYLCIARRNDATLFTLDKKLMEICGEAKVNCIYQIDI